MPEAQILVAREEAIVQVRVVGRATFKISEDLRDFGIKVLKEGVKGIIVDLSECLGMDSTFIGVLAMIGLSARGNAEVVIVNASDGLKKLLDGIGVSRVLTYAREPVKEVGWQSLCEAAAGAVDMQSVAPTVLAAHETLMEIDPENVPKFKDVVDLLKAEMESDKDD